MTRDEVIRLAREVFDVETDSRGRETFSGDSYGIERFAALVAAQERERIIKANAPEIERINSHLKQDTALLRQCLEAMEHLHRTGDTKVFDLCVADKLLPALRKRLGVSDGN